MSSTDSGDSPFTKPYVAPQLLVKGYLPFSQPKFPDSPYTVNFPA